MDRLLPGTPWIVPPGWPCPAVDGLLRCDQRGNHQFHHDGSGTWWIVV